MNVARLQSGVSRIYDTYNQSWLEINKSNIYDGRSTSYIKLGTLRQKRKMRHYMYVSMLQLTRSSGLGGWLLQLKILLVKMVLSSLLFSLHKLSAAKIVSISRLCRFSICVWNKERKHYWYKVGYTTKEKITTLWSLFSTKTSWNSTE